MPFSSFNLAQLESADRLARTPSMSPARTASNRLFIACSEAGVIVLREQTSCQAGSCLLNRGCDSRNRRYFGSGVRNRYSLQWQSSTNSRSTLLLPRSEFPSETIYPELENVL